MIKSLVIVALLAVLCVGMALTRPSEESFKTWYRAQSSAGKESFLEKLVHLGGVDGYLDACTYKNRLLWADIEKDGQTVYSGVFNQWIARGASAAKPAKAN